MGEEELKLRQLARNQLITRKDLILVHTVQLKPTIKAQISGRTASSGTSVVAFTSVYSEKTCLKKLMIMNKSQETTVLGGCQKLTSAVKLRPEK